VKGGGQSESLAANNLTGVGLNSPGNNHFRLDGELAYNPGHFPAPAIGWRP
jgi:hypothetical protein